jgi:protein-disulfide isomerase
MKPRLLTLSLLVTGTALLAACVDTTGLSKTSNRGPNPKTAANAAVLVTEFADLQCPACRGAQPLVKALIEKYSMQIRFEFKHFPIRSIHQYTMVAAEASECAADQGKFWEFEEVAYEKQPDLNAKTPAQWAKDLGLDMTLFDRCTRSHIKKDTIMSDYEEGKKQGVNGTPTFFVNGKKVESSIDAISTAIDADLKGMTQRL